MKRKIFNKLESLVLANMYTDEMPNELWDETIGKDDWVYVHINYGDNKTINSKIDILKEIIELYCCMGRYFIFNEKLLNNNCKNFVYDLSDFVRGYFDREYTEYINDIDNKNLFNN